MKASGNAAASLMRGEMVGGKGGEWKGARHVGMLSHRSHRMAKGPER
jgi:hypothetical protein